MPIAPPLDTIYADPVGVGINAKWLAHILGMLEIGTKEYHWLDEEYHATNQIEEFMTFLTREREHGMIVGQVIQGSFQTTPSYLLPCDGSVYLGEDYPELWAIIENEYKLGNGIQFTVPDFRGRFPIGVGQQYTGSNYTKNSAGGQQDVVLNSNQLGEHYHTAFAENFIRSATGASNGLTSTNVTVPAQVSTQTAVAGGNQPHTNIPPYMAINFYIVART
jgi:microcystin-dependent protein